MQTFLASKVAPVFFDAGTGRDVMLLFFNLLIENQMFQEICVS